MQKNSPKPNKKTKPDQERPLFENMNEYGLPLFIFGKGKMACWKTNVLTIYQVQKNWWKGSYEPMYGMSTPNVFYGETEQEVIEKLKKFVVVARSPKLPKVKRKSK